MRNLVFILFLFSSVSHAQTQAQRDADWVSRSTAFGVTAATRFTSKNEVKKGDPDVNLTLSKYRPNGNELVQFVGDPDASGPCQTRADKAMTLSGQGALCFHIDRSKSPGGAGISWGNWVWWLSETQETIGAQFPNGHKEFYAGETIYVQYRIYNPHDRIENDILVSQARGWKTSIMSRHSLKLAEDSHGQIGAAVGAAGSNQTNEIVINNRNQTGIVHGYNQNGSGGFPPWEHGVGADFGCYSSDVVFQNMIDRGANPLSGLNPDTNQPWTDCEQKRARRGGLLWFYTQNGAGGTEDDPLTGAFKFYPDEWVTIYYKLTIGPYNVGGSSKIELWGARQSDTTYTFLIEKNITLGGDGINNAYDALWLTPYQTRGLADDVTPDTYVMYDEVIVSTNPISAPMALSDTVAPAPPTGLGAF